MAEEKEKEIWKSLDFMDYPDYEVSNFGRVKSLNYRRSGKENILKYFYSGKYRNYLAVDLRKDGKRRTYQIQRLVALAFIPNPQNLPMVNHKDENPSNNHVDNLEWCDNYYNTHFGTCQERIKQTVTKNKGTKVLQFDLLGNFIAEYPSQREAERLLKYSRDSIGKVCRGKIKTYKGFIWKFAD